MIRNENFNLDLKTYQIIAFLSIVFLLFSTIIIYGRYNEDVQNRYQITRSLVNETTYLAESDLTPSDMVSRSVIAQGNAVFLIDQNGAVISRGGDYSRFAQASTEFLALKSVGYNLDNANLMLGNLKTYAAWKETNSGDTLLIVALSRDIYDRTPVWIPYSIFYLATLFWVFLLLIALHKQINYAGESLIQSEAEIEEKNIFNLSGVICLVLNKHDEKIYCNPSSHDHYGFIDIFTKNDNNDYSKSDNLSKVKNNYYNIDVSNFLNHLDEKDQERFYRFITNNNEEIEETFSIKFMDNSRKRFLIRKIDKYKNKPNISYLVFIELDNITHSNSRLLALSKRQKDILEYCPSPLIVWGKSGRLESWNSSFLEAFDLDYNDIYQGMVFSQLCKVLPVENMDQLVALKPIIGNVDIDEKRFKIVSTQNKHYFTDINVSFLGATLISFFDVSDFINEIATKKIENINLSKEIEALKEKYDHYEQDLLSFKQEKRSIEELSRSKSEFLANMSHELKTPLNAINGFSEIMISEMYGPLTPKYRDYAKGIKESGERLLHIINDIIDMAVIESDEYELSPRKINLYKYLSESVNYFSKQAKAKNIDLKADIDETVSIYCDPKAFKQVCNNLLSNALKFSKEGHSILVSTQTNLNSVMINFIDSGKGISKEKLDKIGKAFEILEDAKNKNTSGTGVGLSLATSLVKKMDGVLAISSKENKGTISTFMVPRRENSIVEYPHHLDKNFSVILTEDGKNDDFHHFQSA